MQPDTANQCQPFSWRTFIAKAICVSPCRAKTIAIRAVIVTMPGNGFEINKNAAECSQEAKGQMPCEQGLDLHFSRLRDLYDADERQDQAEQFVRCNRGNCRDGTCDQAGNDQKGADQDEQEPMGLEEVGDEAAVTWLCFAHVDYPYGPRCASSFVRQAP